MDLIQQVLTPEYEPDIRKHLFVVVLSSICWLLFLSLATES